MRIGSLFSGIGGLELGLEQAGAGEIAWQVERDPYCRRVLARHWPAAERHQDVTEVDFGQLEPVDVICGGFPCQDVSIAGDGAGLAGARSGLWREMVRAIRLVGPQHVIVENVAALLDRGMGAVLGDLAESRYDAEWDCLPAGAFGAPHFRDRLFVLAHAQGERLEADGDQPVRAPAEVPRPARDPWWEAEPGLPRVADGVPGRMEFTRALGNAVSPVVARHVGRWLMAERPV